MTKEDKLLLLHFIIRTGMYIYPVDLSNISSFVTGYQFGKKSECAFVDSLKEILQTKYKVRYSGDGWPGQVKRLAEKQSLHDVVTFRKVALETIANEKTGGLDSEMKVILKTRIVDLINRIEPAGHPFYDETWKEQWLSLSSSKSIWFKLLWTKKEWQIITALTNEVTKGNLFKSKKSKLPSPVMLSNKDKFNSLAQ